MIGKIFGIDRLRMGTDGPGITTLVGMYKCPLNCEYCINNPISHYVEYTIDELYDEVKIDGLYFDYTGGGICFGGHEPLLQQLFIINFIKHANRLGHKWKFGVETSLNCRIETELFNLLDYVIIDIKSIDPNIYKKYTENDNDHVLRNLELLRHFSSATITIRIPKIPEYNNERDIEQSKEYLRRLGYSDRQFEVFKYITERAHSDE